MFKSYSEYPFNSIIDEYPDAKELNLVTALVEKWQRALIIFYAPRANNTKEHDAVGSGFLIKTDGVHKILTADHVLDHLQLNNCFFLPLITFVFRSPKVWQKETPTVIALKLCRPLKSLRIKTLSFISLTNGAMILSPHRQ